MTRRSLFLNSGTSSRVQPLAQKGEVDLRTEMDKILFGTSTAPRKGYPLVVRHMRRDADGRKVACSCLTPLNKDSDPDCPYCQGEGYLWDEKWYIGRGEYIGSDGGLSSRFRFTPGGEVRADTKIFFFRYDVPIKYGDKIVEMLLDLEGDVVSPYVRVAIYKPHTVDRPRSDNGRVEFIAVSCLENDTIRQDEF